MTRTQAKRFREMITRAAAKLTNAEALTSTSLFEPWSGEKYYSIGDRVRDGGKLYRCYNAISANPTWRSSVTPAHWEPITVGGGFHEFRIARKIGFYIAEALKNYGCDAVLINYDADMYLTDRIAYVNRGNFDLAAEIHLNAGGGTGSEVYYKHADEGGKKLAAKISAGIAKTFSLRDRGAKTKLNSAGGDYFGFVRSVRCRSLLIETVFIDSSSDRKNVETEAGQKKCGESIAASIAEFYRLCVKNKPQKVAQYADIRAGDRVKIIGKNYATGQRIPSWVKLRTHTVAKVEPSRALLKEINSWVRLSDLKLAARPSVSIGSVVFIKPGAVYGGCTSARGKRVPDSQLSPKKHTVTKVQQNRGTLEALLGDISSWVAVGSLEEV